MLIESHAVKVRPRNSLPIRIGLTVFMLLLALFAFSSRSASAQTSSNYCAPGQQPQFILGFAEAADELGSQVGEPIECEHYDAEGNSYQRTTRGMLYYERSNNKVSYISNSSLIEGSTQPTTPAQPDRVVLDMTHTYQKPDNCGPAATSMALSYYGLNKNQFEMAAIQKPNSNDVNVTGEEVAVSIREVGLGAYVGINGDLDLMIRLLAAGFPVMTEEWMYYDGGVGHFRTLRGYDLTQQSIIYNDSYYGPGLWRSFNDFQRDWKFYNNKFIVPYRWEDEGRLRQLIGANWNPATMYQSLRATTETQVAANPGDALAWWGLGEALLWQGNPYDAVYAFEQSIANNLPWRYLWYRYGYFDALNQVGRHQDLLTVTTETLNQMGWSEDVRYQRAIAFNALGQVEAAKAELRQALVDNPRYLPASVLLTQLGG